MWIKYILIFMFALTGYWNAKDIMPKIGAGAHESALRSMGVMILMFTSSLILLRFLEEKHICIFQ